MQRFNFKFEKIRKLRAWGEEEARLDLGRAVSERNIIESELRKTAEKRVEAINTPGARQNLNTLRVYEAYFSKLDSDKERLLREAAEVDIKVDAAREVWQTAKSELQTLENVKDKRFAAYRKESFAAEERELEDSSSQRQRLIVR